MATIAELVASGQLARFDPMLGSREVVERRIYGTPQFQGFVRNVLPTLISDRLLEETPELQAYDLLHQFSVGGVICYDRQLKPLHHHADGVWELKTADVRMFGYFYRRDLFVGIDGCSKQALIERSDSYARHIFQVKETRTRLSLNPPPFQIGSEPSDVISNFSLT